MHTTKTTSHHARILRALIPAISVLATTSLFAQAATPATTDKAPAKGEEVIKLEAVSVTGKTFSWSRRLKLEPVTETASSWMTSVLAGVAVVAGWATVWAKSEAAVQAVAIAENTRRTRGSFDLVVREDGMVGRIT